MSDWVCILVIPGFFAASYAFLRILVWLQEGARP